MNTLRHIVLRGRSSRLATAVLLVMSSGAVHAQVSGEYIGRLGFYDEKHTESDGNQSSTVTAISDAGYTVGTSKRYASSLATPDQSAWMGSPQGGTRSIGFYDSAHKTSIDRHYSRIVKLAPSGRAIGLSARYDGGTSQTGRTAWLASWGGGTRRIGLYFDSPIPVPGAYTNDVFDLNESGQSIGVATFTGGQHAWVADVSGSTRAIGLMDAAHISSGKAPFNTPVVLNGSGTVIGNTEWSGGQAAWLQSKNPGVPARLIGLYDAAHTLSDGTVSNGAVALNDHGYAIGYAGWDEVFEGYAYRHDDAWVSTPAGETIRIAAGYPSRITNSGLVAGDDNFMYNSGYPWIYDISTGTLRYVFGDMSDGSHAYIRMLTEDGVAIGDEFGVHRFPSDLAWIAPAGQEPVLIGFYDDEHDGGSYWSYYETSIVAIASQGLTVGTSRQMHTGGMTAWIASPATAKTYRIGQYGGIYDGAVHEVDRDWYVFNSVTHASYSTHVTNSRFAAGYSLRFHGDDVAEGQTAWVYNSAAGRYATFDFSVRPSDGYAYSKVNALLENGIAVGTYTKFAEDGTDLGDRAFVWVTGRGAYDLGAVLNVDPEDVGWDYLANGIVVNQSGVIAGHGVPYDSTSKGVYLVRLK